MDKIFNQVGVIENGIHYFSPYVTITNKKATYVGKNLVALFKLLKIYGKNNAIGV